MKKKIMIVVPVLIALAVIALADVLNIPNNPVPGDPRYPKQIRDNNAAIEDIVNGKIDSFNIENGTILNVDIATNADIADTKLYCNGDWLTLSDCDSSVGSADAQHLHATYTAAVVSLTAADVVLTSSVAALTSTLSFATVSAAINDINSRLDFSTITTAINSVSSDVTNLAIATEVHLATHSAAIAALDSRVDFSTISAAITAIESAGYATNAQQIAIFDVAGKYASTTVEGALAELGADASSTAVFAGYSYHASDYSVPSINVATDTASSLLIISSSAQFTSNSDCEMPISINGETMACDEFCLKQLGSGPTTTRSTVSSFFYVDNAVLGALSVPSSLAASNTVQFAAPTCGTVAALKLKVEAY